MTTRRIFSGPQALRIASALAVVLIVVVLGARVRRPESTSGPPSRVTLPIRVIGLDDEGITLVTAASADFEAQVRAEAGKWADSALLSSPQLAIVRNKSPHTIVGYAISFKSTRPDGIWDFHHIEFKYPDAVATTDPDTALMLRDREIRPSEQRLLSRSFEVNPALDNSWIPQIVEWQNNELTEFARGEAFTGLEIAIDAVVFEDGRLLGPNKSQVDTRFLLFVNRKQELYRAATELMASGKSLGDALNTLKSTAPWGLELGRPGDDDDDARVAIGEARRLLAHYGEDRAAKAIRRAVRQSPFTIRRRQP